MKARIFIFITLLALFIFLSSCGKEKKTCEELLIAGLEYGISEYNNNGYIFLKNADEESTFYISPKDKVVMYGEKFQDDLTSTYDFAIYTSATSPYEIAIFECLSRNDADEILRMCYERADEIKVALRFTEWESRSSAIMVEVYKKYVIFSFTESQERNEGVIEAIKSCLN
jgi:hypothetical protein